MFSSSVNCESYTWYVVPPSRLYQINATPEPKPSVAWSVTGVDELVVTLSPDSGLMSPILMLATGGNLSRLIIKEEAVSLFPRLSWAP